MAPLLDELPEPPNGDELPEELLELLELLELSATAWAFETKAVGSKEAGMSRRWTWVSGPIEFRPAN